MCAGSANETTEHRRTRVPYERQTRGYCAGDLFARPAIGIGTDDDDKLKGDGLRKSAATRFISDDKSRKPIKISTADPSRFPHIPQTPLSPPLLRRRREIIETTEIHRVRFRMRRTGRRKMNNVNFRVGFS